ncbi:MAG: hypothetical protein DMG07_10690 [Acidobacteria bacterium]|nr:MAG: hypothetical protein DMG07_10690 [Acidobacteriota bacterium]
MKRRLVWTFCCAGLAGGYSLAARPSSVAVDQQTYVGNVVGTVVDSATGRGVPGATVVLIRKPWPFAGSNRWSAELGDLLLASGVRRESADAAGQFLINRVPTPYPSESYTVVALAPGYKIQVFDQVPVLPGAVMSLECKFALTRGSGIGLVFAGNDRSSPYAYSHERRLRVPARPRDEGAPPDGAPPRTATSSERVTVSWRSRLDARSRTKGDVSFRCGWSTTAGPWSRRSGTSVPGTCATITGTLPGSANSGATCRGVFHRRRRPSRTGTTGGKTVSAGACRTRPASTLRTGRSGATSGCRTTTGLQSSTSGRPNRRPRQRSGASPPRPRRRDNPPAGGPHAASGSSPIFSPPPV